MRSKHKNYARAGILTLFTLLFHLHLNANVNLESPNENVSENAQFFGAPFYSQEQIFLALDTGYRWDKITNRVTLSGPTISVKGSTQAFRHINSYQIGGITQWNFCKCGFIRANGHYGWVFDGNYNEGGFSGNLKGHTYDFEGALGYYFCLSKGIWMAPLIGWSYDALNLKAVDITTAINCEVFHLSDIKTHQRFSGPFIGFDLVFQPNHCWEFTFGYEFHYAHWHGQRLIEGHEYGNPPFGWTTGFSNKRHLNQVYGQVFNLDAAFHFCNCWIAGLDLKYQFFNGDHGKYKQTERSLLSQFTRASVNGLWWSSFDAKIFVGRVF